MKLKLTGYEFAPEDQFNWEMQEYTQALASGRTGLMPPSPAKPLYADDEGNHFLGIPEEDGVTAVPFVPGSPKQGGEGLDSWGGFVPAAEMPSGENDDPDLSDHLEGIAQQIPQQMAQTWVAAAAAQAMLGGAPGSAAAAAMQSLGLGGGPVQAAMSSVLGAAASAAGISGSMTSLLPQLGGMLGGELGGLTDGGCFGTGDPVGDMADEINGIAPGGCVPGQNGPGGNQPSLRNQITSGAVDEAAGQLMSQWKLDDEDSAGEHIANHMAQKYQDQATETLKDRVGLNGDKAAKDPGRLKKLYKSLFEGAASSAKLHAAHIGAPDDKADTVATGAATVFVEGKEISRVTDLMTPSGKQILSGSATVISEGLQTSRQKEITGIPSTIKKGAPTVLIGGPSMSIAPPPPPPPPEPKSNSAPPDPDAPNSPDGKSNGTATDGNGGPLNQGAHDQQHGKAQGASDDRNVAESEAPESPHPEQQDRTEQSLSPQQDESSNLLSAVVESNFCSFSGGSQRREGR